jgi:hypothetical protein
MLPNHPVSLTRKNTPRLSGRARDTHIRPAIPSDAAACVRVRGLTRENAVSEERLRALGITVQSWAKDMEDGALPGFVCESDAQLVGYCFGAGKGRRHVKLKSVKDVQAKSLATYLPLALQAAQRAAT